MFILAARTGWNRRPQPGLGMWQEHRQVKPERSQLKPGGHPAVVTYLQIGHTTLNQGVEGRGEDGSRVGMHGFGSKLCLFRAVYFWAGDLPSEPLCSHL